MKALILTAILLAAGGRAAAAEFSLFFEESAGKTTLTIVNLHSGAVAIATGEGELRFADESDASATALFSENCAAQAPTSMTASANGRIVVHKMSYDEDPYDVRSERQARVVDGDRVNPKDHAFLADRAPNSAEGSGRRRTIRIDGAEREEVARFIEGSALDEAQKSAFRRSVGLDVAPTGPG